MSKELKKVQGTEAAYLANYSQQDTSLQGMDEHVVYPRLILVQKSHEKELRKEFPEGTALIRPGNGFVAEPGESFQVVLCLFGPEFIKWRDRKDNDVPKVMARTTDSATEIARKARDFNQREEDYGDGYKARYTEHLRFYGLIYGEHPLAGTPCVMSFERGEFKTGRDFISTIKMRRQRIDGKSYPVPLFANIWNVTSGERSNVQGEWCGFNMSPAGLVPESEIEDFAKLYKELKNWYDNQQLSTDDDVPAIVDEDDNADF